MRRRTPHSTSFTAMIAKQVCSPAVAQTLKELGVPQESLWYWVASRRRQYPLLCSAAEVTAMPLFYRVAVAAFTVGELGELLPSTIEQNDAVLHWRCEKSSRGYMYARVGTSRPGSNAKPPVKRRPGPRCCAISSKMPSIRPRALD